jgi:hypothetical protein
MDFLLPRQSSPHLAQMNDEDFSASPEAVVYRDIAPDPLPLSEYLQNQNTSEDGFRHVVMIPTDSDRRAKLRIHCQEFLQLATLWQFPLAAVNDMILSNSIYCGRRRQTLGESEYHWVSLPIAFTENKLWAHRYIRVFSCQRRSEGHNIFRAVIIVPKTFMKHAGEVIKSYQKNFDPGLRFEPELCRLQLLLVEISLRSIEEFRGVWDLEADHLVCLIFTLASEYELTSGQRYQS